MRFDFAPDAGDPLPDPGGGQIAVNPGSATQAWSARFLITQPMWATGSYTFNGWLFRDESNTVYQLSAYAPNVDSGLWNLPGKESATVPVFCDSIWFTTWPEPTDVPPTSLIVGNMNTSEQMQRVCINRHNRYVNVAFLDGHAEPIALKNLWKQKWRADWVTPDTLPAIQY